MSDETENDPTVEETTEEETANATDSVVDDRAIVPATDVVPGFIIGGQALLGTVYWILCWFIYVPTAPSTTPL